MVFAVASMLLLAVSCSREIPNGPVQGGEEETRIKMALTVPGTYGVSRSMTAVEEDAINYIDVLVFDRDDKLFDWQYGTIVNDNGSLGFVTFLKTSSGTADRYKLTVLANSREILLTVLGDNWKTTYQGVPYDDIMKIIAAATPVDGTAVQANSVLKAKGIPMWGELDNKILINENTPSQTINLLRALARVDVLTNPNPTTSSSGRVDPVALDNFSLEEVYIYKGNSRYRVAPNLSQYSFIINEVGAITLPEGSQTTFGSPLVYNEVTRDGSKGIGIISNIFLAETDVLMTGQNGVTIPAQYDGNHRNRSAVVIGGKYNGRSAMSWYRVDFVKQNSSGVTTGLEDVMRNFNYQIVIKSVKGAGFSNPDDAYDSYTSDIEVKVLDWKTANQAVVIDGENRMVLSSDGIFVGNEGSRAGLTLGFTVKTTNTTDRASITGPYDENGNPTSAYKTFRMIFLNLVYSKLLLT